MVNIFPLGKPEEAKKTETAPHAKDTSKKIEVTDTKATPEAVPTTPAPMDTRIQKDGFDTGVEK